GASCVNLHFPAGEPGPPIEGLCPASTRVLAQSLAFELAAGAREDLAMASLAAEILGDLRPETERRQDRDKWVDRLVDAISDEPDRRWTLAELARIAGRHPVHVAQAFRAR